MSVGSVVVLVLSILTVVRLAVLVIRDERAARVRGHRLGEIRRRVA